MLIPTILLGAFLTPTASATSQYCQLLGHGKFLSPKIQVSVNCGEHFRADWISDDSGSPVIFENMIDALNYMGSRGWTFEHAYAINNASGGSVYHYLVSKPATPEVKATSARSKLAIEILRQIYDAKGWGQNGESWENDLSIASEMLKAGKDWRELKAHAEKMVAPGTLVPLE